MAPRYRPPEIGPKRTLSAKVEAAAARSERSDRVMSLTAAQSVIGVDRGTLSRWIKRGCPTLKGGGAGKAVQVDLRDVWNWREEQVRKEERERFVQPEAADLSGTPLDVEAEIQRETLKQMKVRTAEKTGLLIVSPIAVSTFAETLGSIRQAVMSVPDRVERCLNGFPQAVVRDAKDEIVDHCRATLDQAQVAMDECVRKLTRRRLAELGIEPDADWDEEDDSDGQDGDGEE